MKFIGAMTEYKVNKDKLRVAISVTVILAVCVISFFSINILIKTSESQAKNARDAQIAEILESAEENSGTNPGVTSPEGSIVNDGDNVISLSAAPAGTETSETSGTSETSETSETSSTDESTDSTTQENNGALAATTSETTAETTEATTETTADPYGETEYYAAVYAVCSLNVRSGPGTNFDVVKTLNRGDRIDVIAKTNNGWYKTYNGNYVSCDNVQSEPIEVTPTPAPQATATPVPPPPETEAPPPPPEPESGSGNTDGMTYYGSCTITFYGPQPRGDGTYSTTTATGATCSTGYTCAADWSVFPAGTVVYVANDPLGGDGYYTVQDRGPGVVGSHLDLYVENASDYNTTTRDVYIVN